MSENRSARSYTDRILPSSLIPAALASEAALDTYVIQHRQTRTSIGRTPPVVRWLTVGCVLSALIGMIGLPMVTNPNQAVEGMEVVFLAMAMSGWMLGWVLPFAACATPQITTHVAPQLTLSYEDEGGEHRLRLTGPDVDAAHVLPADEALAIEYSVEIQAAVRELNKDLRERLVAVEHTKEDRRLLREQIQRIIDHP